MNAQQELYELLMAEDKGYMLVCDSATLFYNDGWKVISRKHRRGVSPFIYSGDNLHDALSAMEKQEGGARE